jgi:hypothetical protein
MKIAKARGVYNRRYARLNAKETAKETRRIRSTDLGQIASSWLGTFSLSNRGQFADADQREIAGFRLGYILRHPQKERERLAKVRRGNGRTNRTTRDPLLATNYRFDRFREFEGDARRDPA